MRALLKNIKGFFIRPKFKRLKVQKDILKDFRNGKLNEFAAEVEYIKQNGAAMFPYSFPEKYHDLTFGGGVWERKHAICGV